MRITIEEYLEMCKEQEKELEPHPILDNLPGMSYKKRVQQHRRYNKRKSLFLKFLAKNKTRNQLLTMQQELSEHDEFDELTIINMSTNEELTMKVYEWEGWVQIALAGKRKEVIQFILQSV